MRKKGAKGAPTAADFKLAAKTARKASGGAVTKGLNTGDMMQSIFKEYDKSMGRRK